MDLNFGKNFQLIECDKKNSYSLWKQQIILRRINVDDKTFNTQRSLREMASLKVRKELAKLAEIISSYNFLPNR